MQPQEKSSHRFLIRDENTSIIPEAVTASLKYGLDSYLRGEGYVFVRYQDNNADSRMIAYTKDLGPARQEPIVIDDGRTVFDDKPVLKIAVRDWKGKNKDLHEKILSLFDSYVCGIPNGVKYSHGTIVYSFIKR